jgi:hypothetical protein
VAGSANVKEGKKLMKLFGRLAPLALVACVGALAVGVASSVAASRQQRTVSSGVLKGMFSAKVVSGPGAGTVYAGTLRLAASRTGYLTGTLTLTGSNRRLDVDGQLHGQLVGLSIAVGADQALSGTGVVGYNPATKRNTIGGTFSGPGDASLGVWDYTPSNHYESQTSAGGCIVGVTTNGSESPSRPGLCLVID